MNANTSVVDSLESSFAYIYQNQLEDYCEEVEYLGVRNLIYGALLNHFKHSTDKARAEKILYRFEQKYPQWIRNKYIRKIPLYKRIFVLLAKIRCFIGLRLMCWVHKRINGEE